MQRKRRIALGFGLGAVIGVAVIVAIVVPVVLLSSETPEQDTTPPTVVTCNDTTYISSTPYQQAYWTEPTFSDNVGIVRNTSTVTQGSRLPYGRYSITTTVFDAANNNISCSYHLLVLAYNCPLPSSVPPDYAVVTCSIHNPMISCVVACQDASNYTPTSDPPIPPTCSSAGTWSLAFPTCNRNNAAVRGNPQCTSAVLTPLHSNYLSRMNTLDTAMFRTCNPSPCVYNATNTFQLCGNAP